MNRFGAFFKRLASFFRRREMDADLDEEIRSTLEMLTEQKIREGMPAAEAARAARIELGGAEQVKESVRAIRGGAWLGMVAQDIRFALRMLRKNPSFTAVAILTLALGIGANTAIFSVVENVLLRPLPYSRPQELVEIWATYPPAVPRGGLSPGDFFDWKKKVTTVSDMAAYGWTQNRGANLTGDGSPQRIRLNYATSNLFPTLGEKPAIGHFFSSDDDRSGSPPVVVLNHRFWLSQFGGDPAVVDRTITLDDRHYTIIGVLPATSGLPDTAEVWMPVGLYPGNLNDDTAHHDFAGLARLKPGVSIAQARAEFEALNRQSAVIHPVEHKGFGVDVRAMRDPEAAQIRESLLVLFAAVGLVLLIACANLINLLLARNAARQKEIALRTALGATGRRLVGQLLTESMLLAWFGGALGIILAAAAVKSLGKLAPANLAAIQDARLNGAVFLFTLAICVLVGIACGLLPALQVRNANLNASLKQGGRGSGAFSSRKLHDFLVVSEIALALIPLVGAGLLLRSFHDLLSVSPGFRAEHLLSISIPEAEVSQADLSKMTAAQQGELARKQSLEFQQIADQVEAIPGVESAAGIDVLPLGSQIQRASRFVIQGQPIPDGGVRPLAEIRTITPAYFETVGISLLRGRVVSPQDSVLSIDINEAMSRRFWPEGDAVGKAVNFCSLEPKPCWYSVVGIVGDVHQFGLDAAPTYDAYSSGGWTRYLMIRTASDVRSIASATGETIHKIDPALPVAKVATMDELLSATLAPRRFAVVLITIFAALALLLAGMGIYGVMSYMVGKRTNEIGIRMALGARPQHVERLIVGYGAKLALLGVAIGVAGSLALTRLMSSLLFRVKPADPLTFAGVSVFLAFVALMACYIPARRAMRVDPMVALRHE